MSKAPEVCLYCKGTGEGPGSSCGFCENGVPLDTQEDWDVSWGKVCGKIRRSWMEAESDGPSCTLPEGHEGLHRNDS